MPCLMKTVLWLCLVVCAGQLMVSAADQNDDRFVRTSGLLTASAVHNSTSSSVKTCGMRCSRLQQYCDGFNYRSSDGLCQLLEDVNHCMPMLPVSDELVASYRRVAGRRLQRPCPQGWLQVDRFCYTRHALPNTGTGFSLQLARATCHQLNPCSAPVQLLSALQLHVITAQLLPEEDVQQLVWTGQTADDGGCVLLSPDGPRTAACGASATVDQVLCSSAVSAGLLPVCPSDWLGYGDHCYGLVDLKLPVSSARQHCHDQLPGANVTSPGDMFTRLLLRHFYRGTSRFFWTGFTDEAVEGEWLSLTGESVLDRLVWTVRQPNGGLQENCATIRLSDSLFSDRPCGNLQSFLCNGTDLFSSIAN